VSLSDIAGGESRMDFHMIDFEGNLKSGVVEWGVVSCVNGRIAETRTGLCRPRAPISPRDAMIHGLRDSMLSDAPWFEDHEAAFRRLRNSGLFAAHHASVERNLLMDYWPVGAINVAESSGAMVQSDWGPWIDSRRVARKAFRGLGDYSLENLTGKLGLRTVVDQWAVQVCPDDRNRPHCALYDAIAAACVVLLCLRETQWDVRGLLRASGVSGLDQCMLF